VVWASLWWSLGGVKGFLGSWGVLVEVKESGKEVSEGVIFGVDAVSFDMGGDLIFCFLEVGEEVELFLGEVFLEGVI